MQFPDLIQDNTHDRTYGRNSYGANNIGNSIDQNFDRLVQNPLTKMGFEYVHSKVDSSWFDIDRKLFESSFKQYFDLNNQFIISKLMVILFPFTLKQRKLNTFSTGFLNDSSQEDKKNPLSADLYIPTMALLTFIMLIALRLGVGDKFQPEYIGSYTSKGLLITLFETIIIKLSAAIFGVKHHTTFIELLSYTTCKYVNLSLLLLIKLIMMVTIDNDIITILLILYIMISNGVFISKSIKCEDLMENTKNIGLGPYTIMVGLAHGLTSGLIIIVVLVWA